jgi:hypothetical protein
MAENRCVQNNSQFTVEIRKRKSVVYEVAVLEIGKSRVHVEQASISGGREPLASKGILLHFCKFGLLIRVYQLQYISTFFVLRFHPKISEVRAT